MGRLLATGMLAVLLAAGAFAQVPVELEQARGLFEQGSYRQALEQCKRLLVAGAGRYAATTHLLAGRCEVRLDRGDQAVLRGRRVLEHYVEPSSPLAAQAHYLMASGHQVRGDYYEAARSLVACLDEGPDPEVEEKVQRHLKELVQGPVAYRATTLLLLARTEEARRVLEVMLPASAKRATVGLLLPEVENEETAYGQLLQGVESGIESLRRERSIELELIVRRISGGTAHAVHAAREMVREEGAWALIVAGSEEIALPVAVEAQASGVPVVLPGLRRPGLNALGPTLILPEVDWRNEGRIAAEYAIEELGLRDFGIVAPYTDMGTENVAGFQEVVDEYADADILSLEWYFPDEGVSLATQFQRLRTIGFQHQFLEELRHAGQDPVRADSLVKLADLDTTAGEIVFPWEREWQNRGGYSKSDSVDADSSLLDIEDSAFQRLWRAHLDSVKRTMEFKTGQIDSNAIELRAFDALYLPIQPGTIRLFAPQFAFYNFDAQRIGNASWYGVEDLRRQKQYVEGLLFTSPYFLESRHRELASLKMNLLSEEGASLTPAHVRGYDAVRILGEGLAEDVANAGQLGQRLRGLGRIRLAAGPQTFDDSTLSATEMWLLQVEEGRVEEPDANMLEHWHLQPGHSQPAQNRREGP